MTPREKKPKKSSNPEKKPSEAMNSDSTQEWNDSEEQNKNETSPFVETNSGQQDKEDLTAEAFPLPWDAEEDINIENNQSEYHEKPTVPRKAFFSDELNKELLEEVDGIYDAYDRSENTNDDFVKEVSESLENDEFNKDESKETGSPESNKQVENVMDGSDLVADIEQEIERAPQAINPFTETESDSDNNSEFISKLNEIFTDDENNSASLLSEDESENLPDNGLSLSSESWLEVIEATEDDDDKTKSSNLFLDSGEEKEERDLGFDDQWQDELSPELSEEDTGLSSNKSEEFEEDLISEDGEEKSVSTLRQSFIEDFEQTPWLDEEEKKEEKDLGWFKRNSTSFKNWLKSLNTTERILIVISSIISIAVIAAILMVSFEWRNVLQRESPPPQPIEITDPNLVYPTGIQLPGGWFFYLSPGEIKNNKWNPQTAEWLQNTTVRRVAAIPWSRQAEAVIQSLSVGDEINLYMNNNDINTYYVEETKLVSRDNVKILSDTEPSLAVILFKSDNSDRWVAIARP